VCAVAAMSGRRALHDAPSNVSHHVLLLTVSGKRSPLALRLVPHPAHARRRLFPDMQKTRRGSTALAGCLWTLSDM
jgi:hypothetical protein